MNFPEFLSETSLGRLSQWSELSRGTLRVSGLGISAVALMVADRFLKHPRTTLVLVRDYREGEFWMENLGNIAGEDSVRFFPSPGLKPYERKLPFDGVMEERLRFFKEVGGSRPFIVVCPLDSFLMRLPSPGSLLRRMHTFKVGDIAEPSSLRQVFTDMGFREEPVVDGVGEFSIRGCIVDVNAYLYPHPIRLEFFGDELESIRSFDIFSQRSIDKMDSVDIFPHGEFTPTDRDREKFPGEEPGALWWRRSSLEKLDSSLLDYLPDADVAFENMAVLGDLSDKLMTSYVEAYPAAQELSPGLPEPSAIWFRFSDLTKDFAGRCALDWTRVVMENAGYEHFESRPQSAAVTGTDKVAKEIEDFAEQGGHVYLVSPTEGGAHRLKQLFEGVPVEDFLVGNLTEGFFLDDEGVAFLTETGIFNRSAKRGRKHGIAGSVSNALLIESLSRGDYVVHEDHGVGRYLGLVREKINGGMVDCVLLEYAGKDRLKFPVSDLQKIEKMQVEDERTPALNKLGNKSWEALKARVKQKVVQIARELVELYAKRSLVEGYAFPPDSRMQEEFEDAFEYDPTPDQLCAIADIKRDMESKRPMDRLICGDVGFGKTEVAMRAAFKCILSKRQVAVLVPTTILAAQHYETFQDRFSAFPVNIALVNRYRTATEKRQVFKDLSEGKIDIVIGTHALLSDKDHFKDLGLLVIDEEQKFGVKQKEHLRELRLTVDTLSMSATPIPRSLHLSMTGVRDISLINTPPMNRLPVETVRLKRDDAVLAQAVKDELSRGGQVFVVNDRVQSIEKLAEDVEDWDPSARVAVAHGQMNDKDLERVMEAFLAKEFDVLVSTSIIESGLDVPNANTIIINNAHHFGISQLYQMRGRVGRSDVLAHAYLVIPKDVEISADSAKRLQALEQFTDLGSGYQLAMRDLEIRGAGNLLGSEQHGFIAEVGFETYVRLVREAVEALRGVSEEKTIQTRVELGIDAFLPEDWIEDGLSRISIYQRIARAASPAELGQIREEMEDRFGPLPAAAERLLLVTEVALIAGSLRIQGIQQYRGMMAMTFVEFPPPDPRMLAEISALCPYSMRYLGSSPLQAVVEIGAGKPEEQAVRVLEVFRAFATRKGQVAQPATAARQPSSPVEARADAALKKLKDKSR